MIRHPFVWSTPDNGPRTITRRPVAANNHAQLDALIARRTAARKASQQARGWMTRRGVV